MEQNTIQILMFTESDKQKEGKLWDIQTVGI